MRLFQNFGLNPSYRVRLARLTAGLDCFAAVRDTLLSDRYGASHLLKPVLDDDPDAFFTSGDLESLQRLWSREQGIPGKPTLDVILLAQLEHHRTEVFYNLDPTRYGSDFVRRLPACVKHVIAWHAAPGKADFSAYDLLLCNFPSILKRLEATGCRTGYLCPSHDPEMDPYAANTERPVDVLFVGGYSRHHRKRAEALEVVARHRKNIRIAFHLDRSRLTRLAESQWGRLLPLAKYRRPADIVAVHQEPVFGRDLYLALSRAKIVFNGAVDMAGGDRGNMRCFESMGCGALLVSDAGSYPPGMVDQQTMLIYGDLGEVFQTIRTALDNDAERERIACTAHQMIATTYSKQEQFARFEQLIQSI
jgi:hypothetical protein